ncbi:MAG TPA: hypothetical protein VJX67_07965, partial [Blastocatellia bacterium]|nr:hypothetical protein [Blastocatellia bacterium]
MTKRLFPLLFPLVALVAGEKFNVKIISRQDSASTYGFVVPGYSHTNTNANVNCAAYPNAVGCNGSATSTTTSRPAVAGSYQVRGATLALQLPDGRVAIVNCDSKTNWIGGSQNARRSCRIPMLDDITAEFSGDKATLRWVVSIDGKKFQQETYKVVAVSPAQN